MPSPFEDYKQKINKLKAEGEETPIADKVITQYSRAISESKERLDKKHAEEWKAYFNNSNKS